MMTQDKELNELDHCLLFIKEWQLKHGEDSIPDGLLDRLETVLEKCLQEYCQKKYRQNKQDDGKAS